MAKYKEPCGCESDDTQWTKLCPEHFKLRENRLWDVKLDSLEWLMRHYDRFPNEDNLHHVIVRLAQVGTQTAAARPSVVGWIRANAVALKQAAQRARDHKNGTDR